MVEAVENGELDAAMLFRFLGGMPGQKYQGLRPASIRLGQEL